jgi:hypothetical protein
MTLTVLIGAGCALAPADGVPDSDAPAARLSLPAPVPRHPSYADALAAWRSPEDINAWIGASFEYDLERALALSESQRARGPAPAIYEPAAFHAAPRGVCVDLARFGVETLRHVAPQSRPRYLMIEFDPARLHGQTLRRHWVALYERDSALYVFADSKRPGVIAGPYATVAEFAADYARLRGRTIVALRELDGTGRRLRVPSRERRVGG